MNWDYCKKKDTVENMVWKQQQRIYRISYKGYIIRIWMGLFDSSSPDVTLKVELFFIQRSTHSSLLFCRKFLKCTQITAPLTWGDIFLLYWLDIVCGLLRGLPRMDVASHLHKGLWCAPTAPERIGEQRAALTTWQLTRILDHYWCNVCRTPSLRREQLFS